MAELNHTIVHCHDKVRASAFLTDILALPPASPLFHFMMVPLSNGVSLDFEEQEGDIVSQHYAFHVSEAEFDHGFARIKALGVSYWADPARKQKGEINRRFGGRGVYFEDPDGHFLELMTRIGESEEEL